MVAQKRKNPNILPQMEQRALNISGNTTTKTNNPCVVGLLWDWMTTT